MVMAHMLLGVTCLLASFGEDKDFATKRHVRNLAESSKKEVIEKALAYLESLGRDGRGAIFEGLALRKDDRAGLKEMITLRLVKIAEFGDPYVPKMVPVVLDFMKGRSVRNPSHRFHLTECFQFLAFFAPHAKAALPILTRYEDAEDVEFALHARRTIKAIEKATAGK